jgi:hypothetical protein
MSNAAQPVRLPPEASTSATASPAASTRARPGIRPASAPSPACPYPSASSSSPSSAIATARRSRKPTSANSPIGSPTRTAPPRSPSSSPASSSRTSPACRCWSTSPPCARRRPHGQEPEDHRTPRARGPGRRSLGAGGLRRQRGRLQQTSRWSSMRNRERYQFLKWGMQAFDTFKVVPPGIGIVHQVNLEYLAKGVLEQGGDSGLLPRHPRRHRLPHHDDQRHRHRRLGRRWHRGRGRHARPTGLLPHPRRRRRAPHRRVCAKASPPPTSP